MTKDMVGGLVVTHGDLATELVGAARKIVGKLGNLEAVSIGWDDDVASARSAIEAGIKTVDEGGGVLILTDMFGGTPTNISLSFLLPGQVEILTGVNLPMLVKFHNLREEMPLSRIAEQLKDKGQQSIQVASEILARRPVLKGGV